MNLSFFAIANYTLILILVVLVIRYVWITYFSSDHQPVQWTHAVKSGIVAPELRKMRSQYPDKMRFYNWWFQVERLKREQIPGAFAEVGVYKGDSAKVLHHLDPSRRFHLFDTFTGFTSLDLSFETGEAATYTTDNFADTSIPAVMKNIAGNHQVILHPGYFPDTAAGFNEPLALVSLDADLYNPTKAGLELFYPLLSPGGVMMVHDYNHKWPGIIKAVDDFVKAIPESLILMPDINGTVMIIRIK